MYPLCVHAALTWIFMFSAWPQKILTCDSLMYSKYGLEAKMYELQLQVWIRVSAN